MLPKFFQQLSGHNIKISAPLKVQDIAGGPSLVVAGFCTRQPIGGALAIEGHYLCGLNERVKIYPSVFVNSEQKTLGELCFVNPSHFQNWGERTFTYIFFENPHAQMPVDYSNLHPWSDSALVVCKYWDESRGDFLILCKSPEQLQVVVDSL